MPLESWDNKASAHEPGSAALSLCSLTCTCSIDVAVLVAARQGKQRISWSIIDLYKVFRYDTYRGIPSKLVYHRKDCWEAVFKVSALPTCFVCFHTPFRSCYIGFLV